MKLAPHQYGPFLIDKKLSPVTYCLILPSSMKIHPIFHVDLLTQYHETKAHRPNYKWRCGLCMSLLGPQYSHVIEKKELVKKRKRKNENTSVGLTTTMQVAAVGYACCCHHCACCLWLCMSSLPCMLLWLCALLLRAMQITAACVICGCACRCYGLCISLLSPQCSHVKEKKS